MKRLGFVLIGMLLLVGKAYAEGMILPPPPPPPVQPIVFSTEELDWLASHKTLALGVMEDAPPYEYMDNGEFKGMSSSYIKIIEEKTGLKFKLVPIAAWQDSYYLLKEGRIKVLSMAVRNFRVPDDILFSFPYVASSLGIFGRDSSAFINNFDDVLEQKVSISSSIIDHMPGLQDKNHHFVVFEDVIEALKIANSGKIDFYVGDILHTKFAMDKFDLDKLRYIAPVVGSSYGFSLAVEQKDEVLLQIINKVLKNITPFQHLDIRQKWTSADFGNNQVIVKRYLNYLYFSFGVFALILVFLFYKGRNYRKKALQIAHTQKMESIGRLAGGVAHDFNNMLAGIHGAAEMLEIKMGEFPEVKKYTDIIINASNRSSYLTSQLLVFSRDKGQKITDMDLHKCLVDAVALLEHGVNKKIVIKTDFAAENHFVAGNRNLIQSMILNLGFNAKDAMDEKGELDISTHNIELCEEDVQDCILAVKPGEYIEIIVKDNGRGIPENIKAKIFEPFFTTKEIGKGTGLGLAAVYGIVLEHKGSIRVESSSEGTTFRIYIPVILNQDEKVVAVRDAQKIEAKILVVDDEKILLELMKDILGSLGAKVIAVNNSLEAVGVYQNTPGIDIVMLDVIMPGRNGVDIYADLLKINPAIKVIFMSGYNKDNEVLGLVEKNSNIDFISKPYSVVDCQQKISKMLAK